MPHYHVDLPLQAPGAHAGDVLHDLERQLDTHVGLGSDGIASFGIDARSREEAERSVLQAIHAIHAGGYFDLHGLHETMGIEVRRYRLGAGSLAELAARVERGFASILGDAPGFVAYHLIDAGGREIVSIRVFADRESLARSHELTRDWVRENLGEFKLLPLERIDGEVLVSRRSR